MADENTGMSFAKSFGQGLATDVAGGAAKGVFGLLGSFIQNKFNKQNMAQQFKYNKDLALYQNQLQRNLMADEMSIKKAGYKEAGLSTAALAGQFGGNASVPSPNGVGLPSAGMPDVAPKGMSYSELLQAQLLDSQRRNIDADTDKKLSENEGVKIENNLRSRYGDLWYEKTIAQLDAQGKKFLNDIDVENARVVNETLLNDSKVKEINTRLDMDLKKLPYELQVLAANAYELQSRSMLNKADAAKAYKTIEEIAQNIENLKVDKTVKEQTVNEIIARAAQLKAQEEYIKQNTRDAKALNGVRLELEQLERDVIRDMGPTGRVVVKYVQGLSPFLITGGMLGSSAMSTSRGSRVTIPGFTAGYSSASKPSIWNGGMAPWLKPLGE